MLAEIQNSASMKFVLKKKLIVLKTITNLHSVNQKTSKGKKKNEMNKCTCTAKKKSYWEIWNSKLEKRQGCTSIGRRHRWTRKKAKRRCKSVDEDVIKFKSMKFRNREDWRRVWLKINKKK